MNNYGNIETRKFPGKDHYTGYSADGRSWRIVGSTGNWSAYANLTHAGKLSSLIGFDRLSEISQELKEIV